MQVTRHIHVTGVVQGVGFRPFVYGLATRLALRGWVCNTSAGVDIVLQGEEAQVDSFAAKALLAEAGPPNGFEIALYASRERYSNIEAMPQDNDLALATYWVRYDMHAITRTPLGGWSRIFAVMKKEDGRWRFQAQFEVPMSLVSQARWTHEAALPGDFPEFARRQNPQYDAQVAKDKRIKARKGEGVPWVTAGENTPQGFKRPDKPATP